MAEQPPYRSALERGMGDLLSSIGISFLFEHTRIPYHKAHHYLPDFYIESKDFYIETKGRFLPSDRKKHLLIREQHPEIDIRFVFQNPCLTLSKRSRTTYGDWATRHGFLWSGKKVPESWFS